MKIEVEIPDGELKEMATKVIADRLYSDYCYDQSIYKRTIAERVRDVIYKDNAIAFMKFLGDREYRISVEFEEIGG